MPTLIQSATGQAIGTSVSATFGSNITLGNSILVTLSYSVSNTTNPHDSGNAYTRDVVGPGTGIGVSIWRCFNAQTQPGAITFNDITSQLRSICIMEWSGINSAWNFNGQGGNTTTPDSGSFGSGASGNSLYLGVCGVNANGLTITDEASWTNVCSLTNQASGAVNDTQYLVAGAQTLDATWSIGSVAKQWGAAGAAYFGGVPGSPGTAKQLIILQGVKRASSF